MAAVALSSSEILQEYAKMVLNPLYTIENYFITFDKTQESFVPFNLFPRQSQIIDAYEKHRFNLVTKPRQAGVSTVTAAYLAAKLGCGDDNNPEKVLILANKRDMAQEFLSKVKDFLEQMPRWIWGEDYYGSKENDERSIFLKESMQQLILPNKCEVRAVATSKDALRGFTPTYLIMDEAAFIDDGAEVFGAALTSLGTGGKATLVSTPGGYDDLYYKTYDGAVKGLNDFFVSEMKWYEDNRYNKDLKWLKGDDEPIPEAEFNFESYISKVKAGYKPTSSWYEAMCRGMNNDKRMIAQELDVSFLGSGGNVIDEETIKYQEDNNVRTPTYGNGIKKDVWVWEKPILEHQYAMGVDVSRGDGEDYSTITIIDVTTMEQVMEYCGKIQPDLLAEIVYEYGTIYDAYVVVDITGGLGVTTVLKLVDMGYKKLHYDDPRSKLLANQKKLMKYALNNTNKVPGLNVNSIRMTMIARLEEALRENIIKVRSARIIAEMRTFVYREGRPDHMKGFHDDNLMSLAMVLFVLEHSFKNLTKLANQTKAMLASWIAITPDKEEEPVAFISKDKKTIIKKSQIPYATSTNRNMQDPRGDYLWLFSGTK